MIDTRLPAQPRLFRMQVIEPARSLKLEAVSNE